MSNRPAQRLGGGDLVRAGMIVIGTLQQPPEKRLDSDDFEVLPADFVTPHRPGDAVGFQAKIFSVPWKPSGATAIAHIAHFRIRNKGASSGKRAVSTCVCAEISPNAVSGYLPVMPSTIRVRHFNE